MPGNDAEKLLEWLSQIVNSPGTYAVLITLTLGVGTALVFVGMGGLAGGVLFTTVLLVMKAFLRFGWPRIEAFHATDEPTGTDPQSLRFDGFSTDVKMFLTIAVGFFVVMMGVILVGSIG